MKGHGKVLGGSPVQPLIPFRMTKQPVEGMVDGAPSNKGNDSSSRSPQKTSTVTKLPARKRESVQGEQPYGQALTRGRKKGKR